MNSLAVVADPLVGKTLQGRYRVLRKLGEGGMGAVYEGEHALIKRRVALKVLLPTYARDADVVRRFLQEATVVTQLRHEHIVDVTDMGQLEDGSLFMVLELLEGRDFAALLEAEGPQPIARVVHIITQMCEALGTAHPDIVHRDLKPENVFLVTRKGDPYFVKILDFGISKIVGGTDMGGGRAKTQTGTTIGTLYYMSPEQAQGKSSVDHRTDIYALGAILFRALTGRYPYEAESAAMVLLKIITEYVPSVRSYRGDVPEALDAIVQRCMAKDAAQRFQTCAELAAALAPFARNTSPVAVRAAPVDAMASTVGVSSGATPLGLPSSGIRPTSGSSAPATTEAAVASAIGAPLPWARIGLGLVVLTALGAIGAGAIAMGGQAEPPSVRIESSPPGAVASIDGRAVGITPTTVTTGLTEGHEHAVELRLDGYEPWTGSFVAHEGEERAIAMLVRAAPTQPTPEPAAPPALAPATETPSSSDRHATRRVGTSPAATVPAPAASPPPAPAPPTPPPAAQTATVQAPRAPEPVRAAPPATSEPAPPTTSTGLGQLGQGHTRRIP